MKLNTVKLIPVLVLALGITPIIGQMADAKGTHVKNVGFAAPVIHGANDTNIPNPEPGAIIYDSAASSFVGNATTNGTSNWVSLSGGSAVPAGVVQMFAGSSAPTGFLLCNGSSISRITYAALFSAIGTTYGVGDGSTTFNLPDTRGVFVRGAGSQTISGITYTGTQGTTQGDQFQGHVHNGSVYSYYNGAAGLNGFVSGINTTTATSGPMDDGTGNGTPRSGAETRPANISLNYIIKY